MPYGLCKLCLLPNELADSHLIPRAAFWHLRNTVDGPANPMLGHYRPEENRFALVETSKHVNDFVFCHSCEDIFNKGGEAWTLDRLAETDTSPLFHVLSKLSPLLDDKEKDFRVFRTDGLNEFDTRKITHFGVGVFLKAAVHAWRVSGVARKLHFGPYEGPLRAVILGKSEFPQHCHLMFCVQPPSPRKVISLPYEWQKRSCRSYSFEVVGLEFVLSLGKQIPIWQKDLNFPTHPYRPVISTSFGQKINEELTRRLVHGGHAKGNLGKKIYG